MRIRKLCVVCSRVYRADATTCPDDGTVLVTEAERRAYTVGDQLGSYRLVRSLGFGGAGAVFEAEHVRLGRRMAIKVLHPDLVNDEMVVRFFNEARAVNEIRHPNIIDIEDFVSTPEGQHYMVMELLGGDDLRSEITRDGVLAPARVAVIGEQIASALAAVHRVGIIHRDLKPENIFVSKSEGSESAKLLDFGVAKFTREEQGVTRAGMTMGTPAYMSPEQILSTGVPGPRSDIYALGIVMYEALAGAPPFNSRQISIVLRAHCSDPVVPPSERRGEPVPRALESVILKCLEKKPEDRFADADELVAALRANQTIELKKRPVERRRPPALLEMPIVAAAIAVLVLQLGPRADARRDETPAPAAALPTEASHTNEAPAAALPTDAAHTNEAPARAPAPRHAPEISLSLASEPAGAQIFVGSDRKPLGQAPLTVKIPHSSELLSLVAVFPDGSESVQQLVPDRPLPLITFAKPQPQPVKPAAAAKPPPAKRHNAAQPKPGREETVDPFTFK